jgi:hypothetical protein
MRFFGQKRAAEVRVACSDPAAGGDSVSGLILPCGDGMK